MLRGVADRDLGAQARGRITYGLLSAPRRAPRSSTRCADGAPAIFVGEDQEYVDKICRLPTGLPALRLSW